MIRTLAYIGAVILSFCSTACRKEDSKSNAQGPTELRNVPYQVDELRTILKAGVEEREVIKKFGSPLHTSPVSPSEHWLIYHSLASVTELRDSSQIIGFQVLIRSNAVVKWEPIRTQYD